jgi:transposase
MWAQIQAENGPLIGLIMTQTTDRVIGAGLHVQRKIEIRAVQNYLLLKQKKFARGIFATHTIAPMLMN